MRRKEHIRIQIFPFLDQPDLIFFVYIPGKEKRTRAAVKAYDQAAVVRVGIRPVLRKIGCMKGGNGT